MKLWEIDQQLEACFDPETGEIIMPEVFEQLSMAREDKLEAVCLFLKDTKAEAEAIASEIKNLTARKKTAENRAEGLKNFLRHALQDEKFKTAKVSVSYRTTAKVEIDVDETAFIEWAKVKAPELLTYKEPEISKTAIKTAIEEGREIVGAHIEESKSIIIK